MNPRLHIVVSRYSEDIEWIRQYGDDVILYSKGQPLPEARSVSLPNVGREGQTYLHHIVTNWNKLADWTVFTQGAEPKPRFNRESSQVLGHMYSSSQFSDYLVRRDSTYFVFSQSVSFDLRFLRFRSGYRRPLDISRPIEQYPRGDGVDKWLHWGDFGRSLEQIRLEQNGVDFGSFWRDVVRKPIPKKGIIYFAQGAQFSVSREAICRNSLEYYETLLSQMSGCAHPYQGWYLEMCWYYIFAAPDAVLIAPDDFGPLERPIDRALRAGAAMRNAIRRLRIKKK